MYKLQTLKIELVREKTIEQSPKIETSKDVINIMQREVETLDRECFWAIPLNGKNKVIGINLVSMGDLSSSIVHPREVFKVCILTNAASVIFVHNHPSGDPSPSDDDVKITNRLIKSGKILGIKILDHLILGLDDCYFSFLDERLM